MSAAEDSEERVQLVSYSRVEIENRKYGQDLERYTVIWYFWFLGTHNSSITEFEN